MTRHWRCFHYLRPRAVSLRYLFHKQRGRCAYCQRATGLPPPDGCRIPGGLYASRDHRTPRALGGSDDRPNLVMACETCNQIKGSMSWPDWVDFMTENQEWWRNPVGYLSTNREVGNPPALGGAEP